MLPDKLVNLLGEARLENAVVAQGRSAVGEQENRIDVVLVRLFQGGQRIGATAGRYLLELRQKRLARGRPLVPVDARHRAVGRERANVSSEYDQHALFD